MISTITIQALQQRICMCASKAFHSRGGTYRGFLSRGKKSGGAIAILGSPVPSKATRNFARARAHSGRGPTW